MWRLRRRCRRKPVLRYDISLANDIGVLGLLDVDGSGSPSRARRAAMPPQPPTPAFWRSPPAPGASARASTGRLRPFGSRRRLPASGTSYRWRAIGAVARPLRGDRFPRRKHSSSGRALTDRAPATQRFLGGWPIFVLYMFSKSKGARHPKTFRRRAPRAGRGGGGGEVRR
jgi:hypothetical protein